MELPSSVYLVVGTIILANLGTIISIIVMIVRGTWYLSKLDSRVTSNEKDIDSAFRKIREVEIDFKDLDYKGD